MEIREFAELSPRQRQWAATLEVSDGGPPSTAERLARARFLRYTSLYAVVDGVPLARVGSSRVPFRTKEGDQTVLGVADVVTRPDALRRGYASRLLRATHRRARAEGLRWAVLWTRRSWVAHGAYERLGYRDVYGPPIAAHRSRAGPHRPAGLLRARPARRGDGALLERLLAEASRDRIGFVPRPAGWFDAALALGWRSVDQYRILYQGRRPVGYVVVHVDRFDLTSREIVVTDPALHHPLLNWLEALAGGRWIGLNASTFLRDAADELRAHGYLTIPFGHGVMMARPLGRASDRDGSAFRAAVDDPRFWLQGSDMV